MTASPEVLDLLAEHRTLTRQLWMVSKSVKRAKTHQERSFRRSQRRRDEQEKVWEAGINLIQDDLFSKLNLDAAIQYALANWKQVPGEPFDIRITRIGPVTRALRRVVRKRVVTATERDLTAIEGWSGRSAADAMEALRDAEAGYDVVVTRNPAGEPIAVASYRIMGGSMEVGTVAGAGHGNVTDMLYELSQVASKQGLGLQIPSASGSTERYLSQMLGIPSAPGTWTADQVATFATTGGLIAPAAAAVQEQLFLGMTQEMWAANAAQTYLQLAMQSSTVAGQSALEHMGLKQTFAWAEPRNMANDLFSVRGSKVVQHMYGEHMRELTKIITDATHPTKPQTIQAVQAQIKEKWPGLKKWQALRIARTETAAMWTTTAVNAYEANGITKFESILAHGPQIPPPGQVDARTGAVGACEHCVWKSLSVHNITDELPPWHPNCRCEAMPVLIDDNGDDWLPPDEPWTGGQFPPTHRITRAPSPGESFGGDTFQSMRNPTNAARAGVKRDIDGWPEHVSNTPTAPLKVKAKKIVDEAPDLQLSRRTMNNELRGVSGVRQSPRDVYVDGLIAPFGGGRRLLDGIANNAYRGGKNLHVTNITSQLGRQLESMGFRRSGSIYSMEHSALKTAFRIGDDVKPGLLPEIPPAPRHNARVAVDEILSAPRVLSPTAPKWNGPDLEHVKDFLYASDTIKKADIIAGKWAGFVYDENLSVGIAARFGKEIRLGKGAFLENDLVDTLLVSHEIGHGIAQRILFVNSGKVPEILRPFVTSGEGATGTAIKYENPFGSAVGYNNNPEEILADTFAELLRFGRTGQYEDLADPFVVPRVALLRGVADVADEFGLPSNKMFETVRGGVLGETRVIARPEIRLPPSPAVDVSNLASIEEVKASIKQLSSRISSDQLRLRKAEAAGDIAKVDEITQRLAAARAERQALKDKLRGMKGGKTPPPPIEPPPPPPPPIEPPPPVGFGVQAVEEVPVARLADEHAWAEGQFQMARKEAMDELAKPQALQNKDVLEAAYAKMDAVRGRILRLSDRMREHGIEPKPPMIDVPPKIELPPEPIIDWPSVAVEDVPLADMAGAIEEASQKILHYVRQIQIAQREGRSIAELDQLSTLWTKRLKDLQARQKALHEAEEEILNGLGKPIGDIAPQDLKREWEYAARKMGEARKLVEEGRAAGLSTTEMKTLRDEVAYWEARRNQIQLKIDRTPKEKLTPLEEGGPPPIKPDPYDADQGATYMYKDTDEDAFAEWMAENFAGQRIRIQYRPRQRGVPGVEEEGVLTITEGMGTSAGKKFLTVGEKQFQFTDRIDRISVLTGTTHPASGAVRYSQTTVARVVNDYATNLKNLPQEGQEIARRQFLSMIQDGAAHPFSQSMLEKDVVLVMVKDGVETRSVGVLREAANGSLRIVNRSGRVDTLGPISHNLNDFDSWYVWDDAAKQYKQVFKKQEGMGEGAKLLPKEGTGPKSGRIGGKVRNLRSLPNKRIQELHKTVEREANDPEAVLALRNELTRRNLEPLEAVDPSDFGETIAVEEFVPPKVEKMSPFQEDIKKMQDEIEWDFTVQPGSDEAVAQMQQLMKIGERMQEEMHIRVRVEVEELQARALEARKAYARGSEDHRAYVKRLSDENLQARQDYEALRDKMIGTHPRLGYRNWNVANDEAYRYYNAGDTARAATIRDALAEIEASPQIKAAWDKMRATREKFDAVGYADPPEVKAALEKALKLQEDAYLLERKALTEVLEEIRPMGAIKGEVGIKWAEDVEELAARGFRGARGGFSNKKMVGAVKSRKELQNVQKFFPSEWLDEIKPIRAGTSRRGYQGDRDGYSEICLSDDKVSKFLPNVDTGMTSVANHELMHAVEYVNDGVRRMEAQFYHYRTSGENLKNAGGYGRDEKFREDKFSDIYMGKDYGGRAYELMTMGMEDVWRTEIYGTGMDLEMRRWVLGMLATV